MPRPWERKNAAPPPEKTDWEAIAYYAKIAGIALLLLVSLIIGGILCYRGEYRPAGIVSGVVFLLVAAALAIKAALDESPVEVFHALLGLLVCFPYWIYLCVTNIDRYLFPLILSVLAVLFGTAGNLVPLLIQAEREAIEKAKKASIDPQPAMVIRQRA